MDRVRHHYAEQSRVFGRVGISKRHREIVRMLDRWCRDLPRCRRVLELGAGAGGVAAAMADLGHHVTAIEHNRPDLSLASELLDERRPGSLHVVGADFYEVEFRARFDFVFCWDGFGVGDDADQRRLLDRIGGEWLTEDGSAILDVFSPWNWQRRDGEIGTLVATDGGKWRRTIEFDAVRGRFRDHVSPEGGAGSELSQTIRVYTLQEFLMLVEGTRAEVAGFYLADGSPVDPTEENAGTSRRLMESNGYLARLVSRRGRGRGTAARRSAAEAGSGEERNPVLRKGAGA